MCFRVRLSKHPSTRLSVCPSVSHTRVEFLRNPIPLWSITAKNTESSTGPLARPFARTAHSFACSGLLAHFTHSLAHGTVNDWMPIYSVFFFLFWPTVRCYYCRNGPHSISIFSYHRPRPFFMGFSALLSLAVFCLLFVFYCLLFVIYC